MACANSSSPLGARFVLRVEKLQAGHLPPLSFEVADGECLAVEGPSGSGKTMLLRALADLDPARGRVFLDGVERAEVSAPEWRGRLRYVSAEPAWWSDTPRAAFAQKDERRLARLIDQLGLTASMLDQPLAQLSTGERQRLALARAMVDEPRLLLLDEPTAALDAANAALVEELLRYQLLARRSLVLVSHDPNLIARLAHERLLLPRALPRTSNGNAEARS
jgi:ABC-type iron transport system FetAB ATPase subunit